MDLNDYASCIILYYNRPTGYEIVDIVHTSGFGDQNILIPSVCAP